MTKTTLLALAFGSLAMSAGGTAFAGDKQTATECSPATLDGSYIYSAQGTLDGQPYASAGIMTFDGEGSISILASRSVEREQVTQNGTYTIESNCSGSMEIADGTVNNFYVGPSGKSLKFVRITNEGAVGGEAKRVTSGYVGQPQGQ